MILTSVDLPAPFSPISALISPLRALRLTASFARTSPNRLVIPVSSSRASVSAKSCPLDGHGRHPQPLGRLVGLASCEEPAQDLGRRQRRDHLRALVAYELAADRADETVERLAPAASREEPALEARPLRGRADHADIAGIASFERRRGEPVIERMAMRENNVSGARRRLGDQRL